ncbi:MAG TPA: hypothetical protein VGK48_21120 [Terriglobia bacterium]|jgi:hypothetical protein
MNERHAKLALLILLLALCAFVLDVLSPVTPTPIAYLFIEWIIFALLSATALILVFSLFFCRPLQAASQWYRDAPTKRKPRLLLSMICVLLC